MSLPVVVNPLAEEDIEEARAYYEARRVGLGDDFMERMREAVSHISAFPEIHALAHKDLRRGPIQRFPYAIIYRVDPTQITVVAVHHTSRDPRSWQSRA